MGADETDESHRPIMKLPLACVIALAFASAPAWGQAGASAPAATIRADVAEWSVVPSVGVVPAGTVRIRVRNLGQETHRISLAKTASFDPQLRLRADRAVVLPLATSVLVRPGGRASFVVSLRPGSYVLLDILPSHYRKGTSAAFSVTSRTCRTTARSARMCTRSVSSTTDRWDNSRSTK